MQMKILITLAALATGLAGIASADMTLDVSPIRVSIQVESGEEYTNAVRVLNAGKEPVRLKASVEDWYLDEIGTPIFRPAGTLEKTASLWVDASPSDFLLEPGQTKFVRYTVKVPAGTKSAGYHGTLLLATLPLDRSTFGAKQMFVQGRIACMMYVTVGDPERSAQIRSLATVQRGDKHFLRMQVENTGLGFVRLSGDMKVLGSGEQIGDLVLVPDVPVLPGSHRYVELELDPNTMVANAIAQITIDLPGIGVLMGECPVDPAGVGFAK